MNTTVTFSPLQITYDSLVVSTGIKNDYEKIDGLKAALEDDNCPVGTIYDRNYAVKTDRIMSEIKSGEVLFTQPNCPIKCGGAPQKVMWLREEQWRKEGVRDAITITYLNNLPGYASQTLNHEPIEGRASHRDVVTAHDNVEHNMPCWFASPDAWF